MGRPARDDVWFRMTAPRPILALAVLALGGGALAADPFEPGAGGPAGAGGEGRGGPTKVDQGITDAGVLNRSLRMVPIDLRVDDAFQNVYEVKGNPRGGIGGKQFMRSAGGLHAVFPQSEYVSTRGGVRPVTPAGVVFWIGEPPRMREPLRSEPGAPTPNAVPDRRVFSAVPVDPFDPPRPLPAASPEAKSMDDPAYRLTVLARVAEAEKSRLAEGADPDPRAPDDDPG